MTSSTKTIKEPIMNSTALGDQADAANKQTLDMYGLMAEYIGGSVAHGALSPRMAALAESLGRRLLSGRTVMCSHLSWTGPQPAFWAPYGPGLIRCAGCLKALERRLKGTNQDYTCDVCRKFSRPLWHTSFMIPARVLDLPELPFNAATPAISIMFGTCRNCRT